MYRYQKFSGAASNATRTKTMTELETEIELETERGDVPGWVLVTLMTAGLVTLIWATAGPLLVDMFTNAIMAVTGP